jgi:UPF0716 protein FxsA
MIELALLIQIGQVVGTLPTIGLIILTGVLGAYLARRQGLEVLTRVRQEAQAGRVPTEALFDGALVLIAGAFLLAPGVITDTLGLLCLFPPTRRMIKRVIWSHIQRAIRNGQIFTTIHQHPSYQNKMPEDVIIIDPDDYKVTE